MPDKDKVVCEEPSCARVAQIRSVSGDPCGDIITPTVYARSFGATCLAESCGLRFLPLPEQYRNALTNLNLIRQHSLYCAMDHSRRRP